MFILSFGTFETISYKNTTISLAISVVWLPLHIRYGTAEFICITIWSFIKI
jgi:hypothetical protein